MQKATSYDEVDWSQFKKGDQFTGLVATSMMRTWPIIISISAPYRVYDALFELTDDGNEDEGLSFKVVRAVPVSVRQTLQPRMKTDGMTQHDRDKAVAAATGGEVESNSAALGMIPIKW